jgi:hypothetical protein
VESFSFDRALSIFPPKINRRENNLKLSSFQIFLKKNANPKTPKKETKIPKFISSNNHFFVRFLFTFFFFFRIKIK